MSFELAFSGPETQAWARGVWSHPPCGTVPQRPPTPLCSKASQVMLLWAATWMPHLCLGRYLPTSQRVLQLDTAPQGGTRLRFLQTRRKAALLRAHTDIREMFCEQCYRPAPRGDQRWHKWAWHSERPTSYPASHCPSGRVKGPWVKIAEGSQEALNTGRPPHPVAWLPHKASGPR